MNFKKYPKVRRLGVEEIDGILIGKCHVQEKIDGANTSIWIEDGVVQCGSRSRHLKTGDFNGFVPYAQSHLGIKKLLDEFSNYRLYGEWLVRHTIAYNETSYKQFYLFDIEVNDKFLDIEVVNDIADEFKINKPHYFGLFDNPLISELKEFVGQSKLGDRGEGIVIKNNGFINKFGNPQYAKIVTEKFKEESALVFGGNNKHSESYWEMYIVQKYMTMARVEKIMNKIQPTVEKKLDITDTPKIINSAYHDMLTEEIWTIQKKVKKIDLKKLQLLSCRKAAKIYHDILNNHISVAYEKNNNS